MIAGATLVKRQTFDVDKTTPKWVVAARKDIGIQEWVMDGRRKVSNPVVQQFVCNAMGNTKLENVRTLPWCAFWLGSKLVDAGYTSTKSGMARSYLRWGDKVDEDDDSKWKLGDIAVFWRGKHNDGITGHVAFLLAWDARYLYILGGNQGDKVSIIKYPRSKLLGIRRPKSLWTHKPVQAFTGSGATETAKAGLDKVIPDPIASAHASTLPDPTVLNNHLDQVRGPLEQLATYKPWIMGVLSAISIALCFYGLYCYYRQHKD